MAIVRCATVVLYASLAVLPVIGQSANELPRAGFGKVIAVDAVPKQVPAPSAVPAPEKPAKVIEPSTGEGTLFYPLQLTPPDQGRLFVIESEDAFRKRLRQEARDRGIRDPLEFPASKPFPQIR